MTVNVDMKDQFVNEACLLFQRLGDCPDLSRTRSILIMALSGYQMQKTGTELVVYQGDNNEKLLQTFLVTKKVNGCTHRTIKYYKLTIEQFYRRVQKNITDVTANDIRIYFAERELKDKVSAQTRDNERRNLSSFFTWLTDEEYIVRNPMKKIPKIKGQKQKKKAFTEMEIEQIRDALKLLPKLKEKYMAIIDILLSTGCRISELCGMKVSEIEGDKVIVHGKGQKDRICYLNAKAQIAIKNWMETEDFKKRASLGNEYLFARKRMDEQNRLLPMDRSSAESALRVIGKIAEVKNVHPHRFRRTCATNALKRGMPIEQVSKMLGHESLETTQIYLDLDEDSLKNAHKKYII